MRLPLICVTLVLCVLLATESGADCRGCLSAGAARVELVVPPGTPLAGYGDRGRRLWLPDLLGRHPHAFWFRPSAGSRDPLFARALVIEESGRRLTWLTVDLVAVDRAFTARVARALGTAGVAAGTLIVSASHTHSGPGAFMDSGMLGLVAVDRHDRAVAEALVGSLVEAARRADAARTRARIGSATVGARDFTRGRLGRPVDHEIVVIKIASDTGAPIALLWNFAIHGTTLPAVNLRLSGDVMGAASRELERRIGVPALFVNGAVADVSPARHGELENDGTGRELAATVQTAWEAIEAGASATLTLATTRVAMPRPHLSIRNCTASWIPRALTVPLASVLPRDAELIAGRLGDVGWVTVPGELQSLLGEGIKRAGGATLPRVFVAGLSNDYLGYLLTPSDYERVTYVACAALYGPDAGQRVTRAAETLVRQLGAR